MAKVKVKAYPSTDTSIVPALFHSSFVADTKCSPKDMEDMVSTWVNIEYDRKNLVPFLMKSWKVLMMCQQWILMFMMMIVKKRVFN